MADQPQDQRLFALCSTLVEEGLAYLKRYLDGKHYIKRIEDLPSVEWSDDGMPRFSFFGNEKLDYKSAFENWLGLASVLAGEGYKPPEFEFNALPAFQNLKAHLTSTSTLAERFFPRGDDTEKFDVYATFFIEMCIDRYAHTFGLTSFEGQKYLSIYLPLESALLEDRLPIEIYVPILCLSLPDESFSLAERITIERMSTPVQLARSYRDRETHEVNQSVLQDASHALVLTDYEIPNVDRLERGSILSNPKVFPLEVIDTFFASLRIVTSMQTGYAQILSIPVGWATYYQADLQPLDGTTVRKYPPTLAAANAFVGESTPKVSGTQLESVRKLFNALNALYSNNNNAMRLPLVISRLNRCHLREDEEDAILDATIGMEILVSDSSSTEVTHKLALRMAALATLVPGHEKQSGKVFRDIKGSIYPYRSAVAHGDVKKADKKREIKTEAGDVIPVVKLATEYLGMALQAVAENPRFIDPNLIDEILLLGRDAISES